MADELPIVSIELITHGSPPALPGDSQSLTIPGIIKSLPIWEPPKVQKIEKTNDESVRKFKVYKGNKYTVVGYPNTGRKAFIRNSGDIWGQS